MSTTKKEVSTTGSGSVKPYTLKELAAMYQVNERTFRNWLQPHSEKIGKRVGRIYTTLQVSIIFESIGLPPEA